MYFTQIFGEIHFQLISENEIFVKEIVMELQVFMEFMMSLFNTHEWKELALEGYTFHIYQPT